MLVVKDLRLTHLVWWLVACLVQLAIVGWWCHMISLTSDGASLTSDVISLAPKLDDVARETTVEPYQDLSFALYTTAL